MANTETAILAGGCFWGMQEVREAGPFWEAEPEHQDYLLRYPEGYTCHFPRPKWRLPRRASARTA
jgi:peptide methionine sulfoxide reductase MsrA